MTDLTTYLAGTDLPELLESNALEDPVAFITRFESAFLTAIGFPGSMGKAESTFHQWSEENLNPDSGTLADATLSAVATTINVTTGQGLRYKAGYVVQFNGSRELIRVVSISTDALTVTRSFRSTTGETQVIGDELDIVSKPNLEKGTAPDADPTELDRTNNYTELFDGTAGVSEAMQASAQIGNVGDRLDHDVLRVQQSLIRQIARTVINGKRQAANPQGTNVAGNERAMDGIIQLLLGGSDSVVIDGLNGAITEDLLNQALQDSWSAGGRPTLIAASPQQKKAISKLLEGRQRFRGDDTTLGVVVERYICDFGVVDIMEPDKYIPKDVVLFIDRTRIRMAQLGEGSPFKVVDLAKTGHVDSRLVSFEGTLEAKNTDDGGHAMIHQLSAA